MAQRQKFARASSGTGRNRVKQISAESLSRPPVRALVQQQQPTQQQQQQRQRSKPRQLNGREVGSLTLNYDRQYLPHQAADKQQQSESHQLKVGPFDSVACAADCW